MNVEEIKDLGLDSLGLDSLGLDSLGLEELEELDLEDRVSSKDLDFLEDRISSKSLKELEDRVKSVNIGLDIKSLSKEEIVKKKVIKDIFNIYDDDFELKRACDALMERARELELEDKVRKIVLYYLEQRNSKKMEQLEDEDFAPVPEPPKSEEEILLEERRRAVIEEKNRTLKWREEVRHRQELAEERKQRRHRERMYNKAVEDLERGILRKKQAAERAQLQAEFKDTLLSDIADNIISHGFIYKQNGELDGKSVVNYDLVVQGDKYIQEHVKFNLFTSSVEFDGELFTNRNLLDMYSYFDRVYKLRDASLVWNALNRPGNLPSYHPIKDIIEFDKWDGVPRIDDFFKNICNVEIVDKKDEIYYREVARMLFFGGITRLYEPGSKFDYMVILKGRQGTCKTTLVRLLALDDSAYSEVTTIDGSVGIEMIKGSWICELAELLAMVRAREVESIKAFITRQYDKYRPPYARVAEVIPRSCIFIGTTNEEEFMSDATGNRRYLPVEVHTNAEEFFNHLEENKEYICQCWREAFYKYMNHESYTVIPAEYFGILEDKRFDFTEDNPVEGLIRGYLADLPVGSCVCGLEIYVKALNGTRSKFGAKDARTISTLMNKLWNWERGKDRKYIEVDGVSYGQQRYWVKTDE